MAQTYDVVLVPANGLKDEGKHIQVNLPENHTPKVGGTLVLPGGESFKILEVEAYVDQTQTVGVIYADGANPLS